MKHSVIVCGVDFSDASRAALGHALRLARASGARLHVVHVVDARPRRFLDPGPRAGRYLRDYEILKTRAQDRLWEVIPVEVRRQHAVEAYVVGGIPEREIVRLADRVGADLIVVGATQRGIVERVTVRTTLAGLLRRARCAVLTVPAPTARARGTGATPRANRRSASARPPAHDRGHHALA